MEPVERTNFTLRHVVLALLLLMPWTGCLRAPRRAPVTPPPQATNRDPLLAHLLGVWRPTERTAAGSQLIFNANGTVVFTGGLMYFNPAQWSLDRSRHELMITLPQTPNEKLDIFHLSVGDGVQAFDRAKKQVTYHFDEDTASLNVAGWMYEKPQAALIAAPEAEPVLK